ncbi:hypothetical protein AOPFMNJM_1682 [Methylobacterium jeotgali]|uniref:Uncharacterized protein n=1 Tax=Methylobacterium jeotgali TaxID=381630 RepID=A0ABQ4SXG0_9HYPH|nr:hypothetical protein [Methylobacterium jeotgali]GJE06366.1 hypothetical protein AOPFMNJM_1682 [Methylobacterium jeotgali]
MTDEPKDDGGQLPEGLAPLRERDPAAFAAYSAAASVLLTGADEDLNPIFWPSLGVAEGRNVEGEIALTIEVLAPFVRGNPGVAPEALYRHASAAGVHDGPGDGWPELGAGQRSSYTAFARVLEIVDRETATAAAAVRAAEPAELPQADFVDVEDTILRVGHDATDPVPGFGEDRVMTIIPATGKVASTWHVPGQAPPPVESNMTRPAPFMPSLRGPDGSDRTGHGTDAPPAEPPPIAGAPAIDGSLAPGGAVPLGHGFDGAEPFTPIAGDPAQAAQDAAALSSVAEEPARPGGVDDPQGDRNAPESGGRPQAEPAADPVIDEEDARDAQDAAPAGEARPDAAGGPAGVAPADPPAAGAGAPDGAGPGDHGDAAGGTDADAPGEADRPAAVAAAAAPDAGVSEPAADREPTPDPAPEPEAKPAKKRRR